MFEFLEGLGDFATEALGQASDIQAAYDRYRGRDQVQTTVPQQQPAYNPTIDLNIEPGDLFAQPNWYLFGFGAVLLVVVLMIKK